MSRSPKSGQGKPRSAAARAWPDFSLESAYGGPVAGIDEAGRGPWAGPVVAAAVVLDPSALPSALLTQLDDSKALTAARRETAAAALRTMAAADSGAGVWFGVGAASASEIDRMNVLQATFRAMARAMARLETRLGARPLAALVDGNRLPALPCPAVAVVGGDSRSVSIAAASILAKTVRDRAMRQLDRRYPAFGWARNAGYGTARHRAALQHRGPTRHHRRSFAPVAALLPPGSASTQAVSGERSTSSDRRSMSIDI